MFNIRYIAVLLLVLFTGMFSRGVIAAELFVIDFIAAEKTGQIEEYIDYIVSKSKDTEYAVIDPRDGTLLVDGFEGGNRPHISKLKNYLDRVSVFQRRANGNPFDLAHASQIISEQISAFDEIDLWNVYFLGSVYHNDAENSFVSGYPNDGFVYLKDTEFGFVDRVADRSGRQVSVHVYYSGSMEFENEYDRFINLWAKEIWVGEVNSFNNALDTGTRPRYDFSEIDRSIDSSKVIQREVRPVCETFDEHTVSELAYAKLLVKLNNPCRANSAVVLRVGDQEFTGMADSNGAAKVEISLNAGINEIEARQPEGEKWTILTTYELGEVRDAIETIVENGKIKITGYHPLRENGTLVTVVNDKTGREWKVSVLNQRWVLDNVPLGSGLNQFWVIQPDGETRVPVIVQEENACSHSRKTSQKRGLAVIRFHDTCLAGKSLNVKYQGQVYHVGFNAAGDGVLKVSLTEAVNRLTYNLRGNERLIEIPVSSFAALIRVTLSWDDKIDLDLHITEPDGKVVYHQRLEGTYGLLDMDNRGTTGGRKQESYVVDVSQLSSGKKLKIEIENWSRRKDVGSDEYCGDGALSTIPFEVMTIQGGVPSITKGVFEAIECGLDKREVKRRSIITIDEIEGN